MTPEVQVACITAFGAIAVALINRGGWKRCEAKLDALAKHLGVRFNASGKVVPVVEPGAVYAEQKQ